MGLRPNRNMLYERQSYVCPKMSYKMNIGFEIALHINRFEDFKNGIDRIYYGNEFCENLIPDLDILENWYSYTKAKNKEFTLVTPFVTNHGLVRLDPLLAFLNKQGNIEIVFNDWGVFKLIKDNFKNLQPVLGRLLTKQRRDPRMLKIFLATQKPRQVIYQNKKTRTIFFPKKIPHNLFEHYQASVINSAAFQKYLLSQNIRRVEIDNLIWEMNIKVGRRIGVSIYLPYGYITTSRMCGRLTLSYKACDKECKRYFLQFEDVCPSVPLYSIGNTLFYRSKIPANQYLKERGINRIIYQPRLPY